MYQVHAIRTLAWHIQDWEEETQVWCWTYHKRVSDNVSEGRTAHGRQCDNETHWGVIICNNHVRGYWCHECYGISKEFQTTGLECASEQEDERAAIWAERVEKQRTAYLFAVQRATSTRPNIEKSLYRTTCYGGICPTKNRRPTEQWKKLLWEYAYIGGAD